MEKRKSLKIIKYVLIILAIILAIETMQIIYIKLIKNKMVNIDTIDEKIEPSLLGAKVTIKCTDRNLYNALKSALDKKIGWGESTNDDKMEIVIDKSDVTGMSELDLSNKGITNLSGLENFTGLTKLKLNGNNISNLTPIYGLQDLQFLYLQNNVSDELKINQLFCCIYELHLEDSNIKNLEIYTGITVTGQYGVTPYMRIYFSRNYYRKY